MAQTLCRVRTCLRKLHSGRTLFSRLSSSTSTDASGVLPTSEKADKNTQRVDKVTDLEAPHKFPLFAEQISKSEKFEEMFGEVLEDCDGLPDIPDSLKSEVDLKQSLTELEDELMYLRALKESVLNRPKKKKSTWGTSDPSLPASDVPCGGCGAKFHCNDMTKPGFIPLEKFKDLLPEDLETMLCIRCHNMSNTNKVINVDVDKTVYKKVIKKIRMDKCLVLMVIDVTDISNSIIPDYINQVGKIGSLMILGNKVDLVPNDSDKYLTHLKDKIWEECLKANLNPRNNIKDIRLISAKTGYGIEDLITKLISYWALKGNVYLVGTTNSGKSTLFNTFLESDYCKSSCRDVVQRATVSQWPGTTLNLLKFPIVKLRPRMSYLRQTRLEEDYAKVAGERQVRADRLRQFGKSNNALLVGRVGKTEFRTEEAQREDEASFVPTGQQFTTYKSDRGIDEMQEDIDHGDIVHKRDILRRRRVLTDDYPESVWTYDTPGLINKNQLINFLTPHELKILMQRQMIRPQVYVMKPGDTMFVTGLVRVDYIKGEANTPFAVFANHHLPVHVVKEKEADAFYHEHVGTETLGLPLGDSDRLGKLPSLCGRQFSLTTFDESHFMASADLQLSSLGWLAIGGKNKEISIRVYTPGGRGMHLRQPALLSNLRAFMGARKRGTKAYDMLKLRARN